jgi:hypothetical protein
MLVDASLLLYATDSRSMAVGLRLASGADCVDSPASAQVRGPARFAEVRWENPLA